jgi:hypothetical protein
MFTRKNRLGMALMLESHLNQLRSETEGKGFAALKGVGVEPMKRLEKLEGSCYVCGRIEFSLTKMFETAVLLWDQDSAFREKLRAQRQAPHLA